MRGKKSRDDTRPSRLDSLRHGIAAGISFTARSAASSRYLSAAGAGGAELVAANADEEPPVGAPGGFGSNGPLQGRDAIQHRRPGNRELQLVDLRQDLFANPQPQATAADFDGLSGAGLDVAIIRIGPKLKHECDGIPPADGYVAGTPEPGALADDHGPLGATT